MTTQTKLDVGFDSSRQIIHPIQTAAVFNFVNTSLKFRRSKEKGARKKDRHISSAYIFATWTSDDAARQSTFVNPEAGAKHVDMKFHETSPRRMLLKGTLLNAGQVRPSRVRVHHAQSTAHAETFKMATLTAHFLRVYIMGHSLPKLPPRKPESHKGTFGRVLLIGGSRGMAGSIALSAMSTLRCGAGLVTVATPATCLDTVAGFHPCFMTFALPDDQDGKLAQGSRAKLEALLEQADCVALGPGLGQSDAITQFVTSLYADLPQPMVVDADGLNALAEQGPTLPAAQGPRILTPHPGEFARLLGEKPSDAEQAAVEFAATNGVVLVLKGGRTLVTDGKDRWRNTTGNPGMATGGSGDVLTGVIAALIGQQMSPWDATRYGVYVHGLAGDLAAEKLGQISLTARDLLDYLPPAFLQSQQ